MFELWFQENNLLRIRFDCTTVFINTIIITIKWTSASVSVMFLYTVVLYYILLLISQYRVTILLLSNARKYSRRSSFLMTSVGKLACALPIFDILLGLF